MAKRKANPLTNGMSSPETEGQGTTNRETGKKKADSSRKWKKRT
ncbi:YuzL family protein [Virgibacillus oceani]